MQRHSETGRAQGEPKCEGKCVADCNDILDADPNDILGNSRFDDEVDRSDRPAAAFSTHVGNFSHGVEEEAGCAAEQPPRFSSALRKGKRRTLRSDARGRREGLGQFDQHRGVATRHRHIHIMTGLMVDAGDRGFGSRRRRRRCRSSQRPLPTNHSRLAWPSAAVPRGGFPPPPATACGLGGRLLQPRTDRHCRRRPPVAAAA